MKSIFFTLFSLTHVFVTVGQIKVHSHSIQNRRVVNFSSVQKKDTFYLDVSWKDTLKNGSARLYVKSGENKIIFDTTFAKISKILGYDNNPTKNDIEQIKKQYSALIKGKTDVLVLYKIQVFFIDQRFTRPAIKLSANYDTDLDRIGKNLWLGIQKDQQSVSYAISILDEISINIVYSRKLGKVIDF